MKKLILVCGVILFTACTSGDGTPVSPPPTQASGGGMDGSGGDASASTADEVKATIKRVWEIFPYDLSRLQIIADQMKEIGRLQEDPSLEVIARFLDQGPLAKIKSIELQIKETEACYEYQEPHDGSYSPDGKVCLSVSRLRRIPEPQLREEIFALIAHELGHSVGFQEGDAELLQKAMIRYDHFSILYKFESGQDFEFYKALARAKESTEFLFLSAFYQTFLDDSEADTLCPLVYESFEDRQKISQDDVQAKKPVWLLTPKALHIFEKMHLIEESFCSVIDPYESKLEEYAKWMEGLAFEYAQIENISFRSFPDSNLQPEAAITPAVLYYRALQPFLGKKMAEIPETQIESIECRLESTLPSGETIVQDYKRAVSSSKNFGSLSFNLSGLPESEISGKSLNLIFRKIYQAGSHLKEYQFPSVSISGLGPGGISLKVIRGAKAGYDVLNQMNGLESVIQKGSVENISVSFQPITYVPNQPTPTYNLSCRLQE